MRLTRSVQLMDGSVAVTAAVLAALVGLRDGLDPRYA
jgi:hypothetical protein